MTEPAKLNVARTIGRRALVGGFLLFLAFALDGSAYQVLRTLTRYEHWGEMREGLTTAKFLASGLGTAVILVLVGFLDRLRWRRAGVLCLVVLTSTLAAGLLKMTLGRERPSHLDQVPGQERNAFHGPAQGMRHAWYQSFPSGHTTSAFTTATCLAAFYPPARVVFFALASATAVNRVVKHQHFLSDVVGGGLFGHLMALWLLSRPGIYRRWAQTPGCPVDTTESGP